MIETLWALGGELWDYLVANFDPARDLIDITLVTVGIYWLLPSSRARAPCRSSSRLIVLFALYLTSAALPACDARAGARELPPVGNHHHHRALPAGHPARARARVGRGFFPSVAAREESQMLEELVRAAQTLAQRKVGALIVLERENHVGEQIETGSALDAAVSKDLLVSLFMPRTRRSTTAPP